MPSADVRLSRGKTLAFALLVVSGFFGLLELGARLSGLADAPAPRILLRRMDVDVTFPFMQPDRELFWAPLPGFRGRFLDRPVAISSFGTRGPEPASPPHRVRVLSFGDSITFGYGVGDDETYPAIMGRELQARGVEVVNAGVTGYTSHQVLGLVRRLLPTLRPRLVTICIGWNDGNRRAVDDREWARRLSRASPLNGALERVATFRAMTNLYVRSVVTADKRSGATTARVPLAHYRETLATIAAACRTHGATPVFVDLPHVQPLRVSLDRSYRDALFETSRALDAPWIGVGDFGLDSPRDDTGESLPRHAPPARRGQRRARAPARAGARRARPDLRTAARSTRRRSSRPRWRSSRGSAACRRERSLGSRPCSCRPFFSSPASSSPTCASRACSASPARSPPPCRSTVYLRTPPGSLLYTARDRRAQRAGAAFPGLRGDAPRAPWLAAASRVDPALSHRSAPVGAVRAGDEPRTANRAGRRVLPGAISAAAGRGPGFQNVRYPERLSEFLVLAFAPLVAAGLAALRPRLGAAGLSAVSALVYLECLALPMKQAALPPPERLASVYRSVAGSRDARVVAEVPAVYYTSDRPDALPMWASLAHGKRTVQAHSGYVPPTYALLKWRLFHFPSDESVDFLRRFGVDTVIVHPGADGRPPAWAGPDPRWTVAGAFPEGHVLLRLPPGVPFAPLLQDARLVEVVRDGWTLRSQPAGAERLLDGDTSAAWAFGARPGQSWLEVSFGRPLRVSRIALALRTGAWRFPARVKLLGRAHGEDGLRELPYDARSAYDSLASSLLFEPLLARLSLDLEPTLLDAIELRGNSDAFRMPAEVAELRVYSADGDAAALTATWAEGRPSSRASGSRGTPGDPHAPSG